MDGQQRHFVIMASLFRSAERPRTNKRVLPWR
jgi:hypothetical protein